MSIMRWLENVTVDKKGKIDYADKSVTENTRVSYPIFHIENIVKPVSKAPAAKKVIFLSADAFGVLPPVSILTPEQTKYYFLSGFTAKLAGTERGITEPTPTFSACFGAAFLSLHPTKYGEELVKRMKKSGAKAYLVNTGWNGTGKRISIKDTRGIIDSICTLTRTGDPEPSILSVNRTLPKAGEVIKVTGRNLQFVDHVYLPIVDGEMEITDFTPGSKEISFILPPANYTQGSIRMASTSAKVNCYSPAYMFCKACVFFYNFKSEGLSKPYAGSEFEYTIKDMGSLKDKVVNLASDDLPEGHSLTQAQGLVHPDSLLSFYGGTPIEWPVATKTDDKKGYLRFSSGDRFEYVLNNCNGLFTERTPCGQLAIQMDIYVMSDDKPEWSTGYMSWRLNKDQSALDGSMTANVAGWEKGAPLSFAEGWRTFTIPLSKFTATQTGAYSTLGGLIAQLKGSNLQTILTIVNYPLDGLHPATALSKFQFNIANIRLVPYNTPANTPIE